MVCGGIRDCRRKNRIPSQIYKARGYTEYPQLVIRHHVRDIGDLVPT